MPKKLDIFDFDGTLFNSPEDTPENRAKYERAKGIPWLIDKQQSQELTKKHGRFIGMRRGWWGRAETLEPPLVADPAPPEWFNKEVCEAFLKSKADPDCLTIILTGRFVGLRDKVLRILADGDLIKVQKKVSKTKETYFDATDDQVQLLCLGEDGPKPDNNKPAETFPWKLWIIRQFLDVHPDIEKVEIWEDRPEHVVKFKELDLGISHQVNEVV